MLFEPDRARRWPASAPTRDHVLLNELDNVEEPALRAARKDGKWKREQLPGMPEFGTVGVAAVDADESDDYFLTVDRLPDARRRLALGTRGRRAPPRSSSSCPRSSTPTGWRSRQHEADLEGRHAASRTSRWRRKDLALDGKNPTLLYGYGGFEISMPPGYQRGAGAAWLEKGGVYVVANIRGGGEFGPKWHQAALKANRHRAYEDFAAVAEDLIRRKVTSTPHLGHPGRQQRRPADGQHAHACARTCSAPSSARCRCSTCSATTSCSPARAGWREYGNPDDPEGVGVHPELLALPQRSKDGVKYPRTLFTTSTRDDRVHPGHARKMVAKMSAMGHDVLYYENIEGGHGGAADNKQAAFMSALAYTFLWQQLGMLQQAPQRPRE